MDSLNTPVVMVIDPDALTLTAIAAMLDSAQCEVYCAQDRAAALKGATRLDLDLVVCDEDIDDGQGAGLVSELRQLPGRQDVPIMYMSRHQLPDVISRPCGGGAAYHIRKPVEPRELLKKIDQALYELPLINQHLERKRHRPHFSAAVTTIVNIPNVSHYADAP